jgi:biopolymer transport protein TolR
MTIGNSNRGEINVTPMIDILLVLLLIFMLIVPQRSTGLDTTAPQPAASTDTRETRDVVIKIAADRGLTINTVPVTWSELGKRFVEIYARRADKVLFVRAEPSVEFNAVAQVIDTAKGVGVDHIAFMPREK